MPIIEIELLPKLFRRMPMNPLDAAFDGIGGSTVPGECIRGFFRRHRSDSHHTATVLVLAHVSVLQRMNSICDSYYRSRTIPLDSLGCKMRSVDLLQNAPL